MYSSILPTIPTIDKGLSPNYQLFKDRYNLDGLVQDIKKHLGHAGGISSDEVDSEYLISLMKKYISDPSDWIEYFHNDTSKNYTRNAIENINHKANIVSLPSSIRRLRSRMLTPVAPSCLESWKRLSDS